MGFQKDTPASVVFHASNLLKLATAAVRAGVNVAGGKWERVLQWCGVEQESWNIDEVDHREMWKGAVSFSLCTIAVSFIT